MTTTSLATLHERHLTRNHRRAETAISLVAAETLWNLLEQRQPSTVLEMGSGFSTTVIRTWQNGGAPVTSPFFGVRPLRITSSPPIVYTTDTSWRWLGATLAELELEGLDTSHMLHHDIFARLPDEHHHARFDLIFLDLADSDTRVQWLPRVMDWLAPQGLLVLDDWQMPHYQTRAQPVLREAGFVVTPLPETRDAFGRYLALAEREAA
jgi:hypothetical protein